ncbi:PEP-CTERM sorting domain-containing protein [Erythrobacter sp. 3-20A1M]|uniref:PEPxxWA-CTERM sorting domain-containing protein n=1 Tax=Erythrobacter sp. 3-20A1M TaxID=2653850 RepID=UPI001BFC7C09|nr:PEPxxWA-CTERM sorting domain-containing protein [Erythrobacter sp. 3-20A1M]QWC55995.1 PEP-CTERM sorting domain-containing protein [Erythrobacter sp. 3-20A1M]
MLKALRLATAAAIAIAAPFAAQAAETVEVAPATADRMVTVSAYDPIGQSFTATTDTLSSFGFRFGTLNASSPNTPLTFRLLAGETLTGSALFTQVFTLPSTIAQRGDLAWVDIALPDLPVTMNSIYTAVLTATSSRAGLQVGPGYSYSPPGLKSGDVYAGGKLLSTGTTYSNCAGASNNCDAVFRYTGEVNAAGAVPEPATWALMILGFAAVGGSLRKRGSRSLAFNPA